MLKKLLEHFIKRKRQLVPVPVDLSKLSDVVKNDVVKKAVYDKLVAKANNVDTSGFLLKTKYDTDKSEIENKIPNISDLVKKVDYNTKITEINGKIPDIISLATKTELTTVKNKIPDVSSFVKKTDYNTKITGNEKNSLIIIMINTLQLQSLILQLPMFLMQDQHKHIQWQKQILMLNCQVLTEKLLKRKQNTYLLKMS